MFIQFCLRNIYEKKNDYVESDKVSSQGNVCDFSVNFDAIDDKSEILDIQKYFS